MTKGQAIRNAIQLITDLSILASGDGKTKLLEIVEHLKFVEQFYL